MSKLTRILLLLITCLILITILLSMQKRGVIIDKTTATSGVTDENQERPYKDALVTKEQERDAIKNRPFPLAGMTGGQDDDTDTIQPTNKEPALETYSVGTSLTTRHGVKVSTTFYNRGDRVTEGYGYSQSNPSPKTNGTYSDLKLSLENLNKTSFDVIIENIKLIDQEKREYFPIKQTRDCGFVNVDIKELDTINGPLNPSVPCIVNLLFEVSTSTNSFLVRFDIN